MVPTLEQLDLEAAFHARAAAAGHHHMIDDNDPRIRELIDLLGASPGWMTAAQIEEQKPDWSHGDHRVVRALAEKAEPHVIGGNNGYRLTRDVNPNEFAACTRRIRSQVEKMTAKLTALETFYRNKNGAGMKELDQQTIERAFFGALTEKDRKGDAHINVAKFVELLDMPVNEHNCNAAAEFLREAFNNYSPSTTVIVTR